MMERDSTVTSETTLESIPENGRIEEQLLVRVTGTKELRGNRKTRIVGLVDRFGTQVKLDFWEKHDVDTDWTVREWYAVSNTRAKVWNDSDGETKRRLRSTSDLEVDELGATFSPSPGTPQEDVSFDESTQQDAAPSSLSPADTTESEGPESRDEVEDDDADTGIFDAIQSEFDDLSLPAQALALKLHSTYTL